MFFCEQWYKTSSGGKAAGKGAKGDSYNLQCFSCGRLGHRSADCPKNRHGGGGFGGGKGKAKGKSEGKCCHKCGQSGHFASNCYANAGAKRDANGDRKK